MCGVVNIEMIEVLGCFDCDVVIIIELFYQINKVVLIECIVELVNDKKFEGIFDICDESDCDGMWIVVELCCDVYLQVVFNNLFKFILLQSNFSVYMLVLVNGELILFILCKMFEVFFDFWVEMIECCICYLLCKVEECDYILLGLLLVFDQFDLIIVLIWVVFDMVMVW